MAKAWAAPSKSTVPLLCVKLVTSQSPATVVVSGARKFAKVEILVSTFREPVDTAVAVKVPVPDRVPVILWAVSVDRMILPSVIVTLLSAVKIPVVVKSPAVDFNML